MSKINEAIKRQIELDATEYGFQGGDLFVKFATHGFEIAEKIYMNRIKALEKHNEYLKTHKFYK